MYNFFKRKGRIRLGEKNKKVTDRVDSKSNEKVPFRMDPRVHGKERVKELDEAIKQTGNKRSTFTLPNSVLYFNNHNLNILF